MKKIIIGIFFITNLLFAGGVNFIGQHKLKVAIGQFSSGYKKQMEDWIQRYLEKYEVVSIDLETDRNNTRIVSIYYKDGVKYE